jgi:GTP cyclohydrolase I
MTVNMNKVILAHGDITLLAKDAARKMHGHYANGHGKSTPHKVYAVPRGGIPAAYAIGQHIRIALVDTPQEADYIVDDLCDSGETMLAILNTLSHPVVPVCLIDKASYPQEHPFRGWIVFPWEGDASGSLEDNVRRTLQFIGEDPARGGLTETPRRVAKAWEYWAGGYSMDPGAVLKVFEDGAEGMNEMVMVKDIPFYSHCEHHMAPFFGKATVAYIPDGRIVGLSKINRLVDGFARRLQVQERLTTQIADAIATHLQPKGVGVILSARHLCMESRGVCQHGHSTTTSALRGVMVDGAVRQEFLHLARS